MLRRSPYLLPLRPDGYCHETAEWDRRASPRCCSDYVRCDSDVSRISMLKKWIFTLKIPSRTKATSRRRRTTECRLWLLVLPSRLLRQCRLTSTPSRTPWYAPMIYLRRVTIYSITVEMKINPGTLPQAPSQSIWFGEFFFEPQMAMVIQGLKDLRLHRL